MPVKTDPVEAWIDYSRAVDMAVERSGDDESCAALAAAYGQLDGRSAKGKARAYLQELQHSAAVSNDDARAAALGRAQHSLRLATSGGVAHRKAVLLERFLEDAEAIQLAYGMFVTNPPDDIVDILPEGWLDALSTENSRALVYRAWLMANPKTRGAEPIVSKSEKKGALISVGKSTAGTGRRPATGTTPGRSSKATTSSVSK